MASEAKKPVAVVPVRRPATLEELRQLQAMAAATPRVWVWAVLLAGVCVSAIIASIAGGSGTGPTATGVLVGALGLGLLLLVVFTVVFVRRFRAGSTSRATLAAVDPALAPVVPIGEGDRLGGWVVLEASAARLHVARAQSLAVFRLSRAGALMGALALMAGMAGGVGSKFAGSSFRPSDIKILVGMVAGTIWCTRFALTRSAYQWTVEDHGSSRELVMQDAALFGASRLVSYAPGKIRGFGAGPREVSVHLDDGTTRPLAGLGGSPLAGWRASCVATTVGVMLGLRTTLTVDDEAKRRSEVPVPAELADSADLSASTTALLQVEEAEGET